MSHVELEEEVIKRKARKLYIEKLMGLGINLTKLSVRKRTARGVSYTLCSNNRYFETSVAFRRCDMDVNMAGRLASGRTKEAVDRAALCICMGTYPQDPMLAQRTRTSHLLRLYSRRERLHAHLCTSGRARERDTAGRRVRRSLLGRGQIVTFHFDEGYTSPWAKSEERRERAPAYLPLFGLALGSKTQFIVGNRVVPDKDASGTDRECFIADLSR
ncbi:hypothetical protein DBV15_03989 [Temnothorax longispinosus]|uniref:Uncharacterized protein n=1 Tax=Temnothorax longispinosus TaxID=300112 RepID=A0A4V3SCR3_9HYME|nr:hypothetical protein DBV15_03989 [Temnothorax longispinosus]